MSKGSFFELRMKLDTTKLSYFEKKSPISYFEDLNCTNDDLLVQKVAIIYISKNHPYWTKQCD